MAMTENKKTPHESLGELGELGGLGGLADFANLPDVRQRLRDARKIVDDIDGEAEMGRLREIAADMQERAAELGRIKPDDRLEMILIMTGVAAAPAAAPLPELTKLNDESGPSKRERQILAIVAAAVAQGFGVLSIPDGGKGKIRKHCMASHSDLFGVGPDPFKEAWQKALDQNRVRTARHNQYAKG